MAAQLTLADAQRVLEAALAEAEAIGQPMNVAVVDAGGHLLAFARQDGAILGSIDIAIRKARTAVLMKMSTAALGEAAAPGAPLYGIEVTNDGMVIFGGGIPLARSRGPVVGAIGVSAGSVEQDTVVAEAGVAALRKRA
ncbi:MAG TPA: heme-binding protein [Amycolatopsis sp.]|nr:heme-binding protein [Amycolatopsis sp.]